jgi:hypothetical protein
MVLNVNILEMMDALMKGYAYIMKMIKNEFSCDTKCSYFNTYRNFLGSKKIAICSLDIINFEKLNSDESCYLCHRTNLCKEEGVI